MATDVHFYIVEGRAGREGPQGGHGHETSASGQSTLCFLRPGPLSWPCLPAVPDRGPRSRNKAPASGPVTIRPTDTIAELVSKAARVVPSERQLAWQALEFQAFVHFGMNTFTDREWGEGTEDPKLFNPTDLDANQWVEAVKAAGIKGLIVTAKHHDGFCLWPSRFTEHSVKNSPWKDGKGDVVGEVAAACRKAGLAFGVYLSPWDRHEPTYGDSPRYNEHFKDQLRELLTNYGEISEVWFDGACGEGPNGKRQVYDWDGYFKPHPRAPARRGHLDHGPGRPLDRQRSRRHPRERMERHPRRAASTTCPTKRTPAASPTSTPRPRTSALWKGSPPSPNRADGFIWYPGQVDVSIRPGWFYHAAEDDKVKTLDQLLDIYYTSVGGNAQLLLNIPPDKRGRIHENDVRRLKELGDRLRATFADNLAAKARISMIYYNSELVDGIDERGRATGYSKTLGTDFEIDLGGPKRFNVAMLKEDLRKGQQVEAFAFDIWDGKDWKEIARGTTVGYQKLLRFPAVEAAKVRVRILKSRDKVSESLPELFFDPGR